MNELVDLLTSFAYSIKSPPILFFLCGIVIGLFKTDLHIPQSISKFLSIYLMIAIGFKGGVALAQSHLFSIQLMLLLAIGITISFLLPFIAFFFIRKTTHVDRITAAAIAAHYGSVSIVTFLTAESFLKAQHISYAPYMIAILASMEAPAILSGIYLAQIPSSGAEKKRPTLLQIFKTNGCLLLLIGSFIIGLITGEAGFFKIKGFIDAPFQGILCLFLLDMGLLVAAEIASIKRFTWSLFLFGLYMPLLGAGAGLIISYLLSLGIGTGTLFMILCASASYIAVPAAMRLAMPQASAAIYLPLALAITFPFNVVLGIPLYYALASYLLS